MTTRTRRALAADGVSVEELETLCVGFATEAVALHP